MLSIRFSEVLQHLETWGVIPCPSPVHSKDEDNPTDQQRRDLRLKLAVTCHHGEASHVSRTNLANIPSYPTPIEKYQQDTETHEEFACGYRQSQLESRLAVPLDIDPNSDTEESVLSCYSLIFLDLCCAVEEGLLTQSKGT